MEVQKLKLIHKNMTDHEKVHAKWSWGQNEHKYVIYSLTVRQVNQIFRGGRFPFPIVGCSCLFIAIFCSLEN